MARFTSLEFMEALGLGYFDYNGAKILLRLLQQKGIAKEVDKVSRVGKGRKMTVYELPEEITIRVTPTGNTPIHPPKKKRKKVEAVVAEASCDVATQSEISETLQVREVQEPVVETAVPEASGVREYEFDEGWDDD